jgi:pimeloyl-ACP methyl ester carboxylesterase
VYARSSFNGDERRTREFDIFFEPARLEAERRGEPPLDTEDSLRFVKLYYELALRGDRDAIWRFFVFENNLVEEDPAELLDPLVIDEKLYPEATSVTLFESRLFVRGTFEEPANLLESVGNIKNVPTWVVQGTGDEVCPDTFARQLVARLQEVGVNCKDYFVDAGHRASSTGIATALKASVDEFYSTYCVK